MRIIYSLIVIQITSIYADCAYPHTNKERIRWMEDLIITTQQILNNHNISSWIAQGTLLGAYRNKKVLEWTSDVDIQINQIHINDICNTLIKNDFLQTNLLIFECTSTSIRICKLKTYIGQVIFKDKEYSPDARLDIYGSQLRSDGLYNVSDSPCLWNFTELYPLRKYVLLNNRTFIGPHNPIPWLVTPYGPDWAMPKYYSGNMQDQCYISTN